MTNKENIINFCQLVEFINTKNAYLQVQKEDFYYGGHPFEECFESDIEELDKACEALEHYIKIIG